MNAIFKTAIVATLSAAVLPGCAGTRVRVNAYLSHDLPFPSLETQPPATIAVVVGSEPDEPLLEAEVSRKVEHLIRELGYGIGTEEDADYVLACWLSIDQGPTETVCDYTYATPRFTTSYVYHGRRHWSAVGFSYPGFSYPMAYSYTYYTRFLGATLYERERWAAAYPNRDRKGAASEKEVARAAVWTCTAASTGSSSDLRTIANFLLAAAFQYFGQDTGREVHIRFTPGHPRVAEIMLAGKSPTGNE
ncbi:MAG: hypothetical protein V3W34_05345 [Phycisphaerae bacterium]